MIKNLKFPGIEKYLFWIIFGLLFVFWGVISFLSEGGTDIADSLIHFKIARQAFKQHELFLDLWAKPVFTILCSPFAQFGYDGAKFFNLLIAMLSAWFGYKIAQRIQIRNAYIYPIFLLFFPVYSVTMISSLTEIVFGFLLIMAIYFYFRKNILWSAIIISFIPFARTEGFGLLPAFAFVYLVNKNYRALPFLFPGTILFSFIGWNHHHDIFWVFTKIPYSLAGNIYGSGDLFFYWHNSEFIVGKPIFLLIALGSMVVLFNLYKSIVRAKSINTLVTNEFLLIWMVFFGYILFQSVIWYKGILAVLGSYRFIACVAPLGALIALRGFDSVINLISSKKWLAVAVTLILVMFVVKKPFKMYQFPIPLDVKAKLVKDASVWIKKSDYMNRKVFYANPLTFHFLQTDPYNTALSEELNPTKVGFEQYVPTGELVLWDAHFSANEGQLPDSRLLMTDHFRILKSIYPKKPLKVLGNRDYAVHVAEKIFPYTSPEFQQSFQNTVSFFNSDTASLIPYRFVDFDGDYATSQGSMVRIIDTLAQDNAVILNPANPFLLVAEGYAKNLPFIGNSLLYFNLNVEAADFNINNDAFLSAITVTRKDDMMLFSESTIYDIKTYKPGFVDIFPVKVYPVGIKPNDYVKIYFHYQGNGNVYINSLLCVYSKHKN